MCTRQVHGSMYTLSLGGLRDLPGNLLFGPAHAAAPHLRGRGARVLLLLPAHVDRLSQSPRDGPRGADCYRSGRIDTRAARAFAPTAHSPPTDVKYAKSTGKNGYDTINGITHDETASNKHKTRTDDFRIEYYVFS